MQGYNVNFSHFNSNLYKLNRMISNYVAAPEGSILSSNSSNIIQRSMHPKLYTLLCTSF
jgi:hypothetical protein